MSMSRRGFIKTTTTLIAAPTAIFGHTAAGALRATISGIRIIQKTIPITIGSRTILISSGVTATGILVPQQANAISPLLPFAYAFLTAFLGMQSKKAEQLSTRNSWSTRSSYPPGVHGSEMYPQVLVSDQRSSERLADNLVLDYREGDLEVKSTKLMYGSDAKLDINALEAQAVLTHRETHSNSKLIARSSRFAPSVKAARLLSEAWAEMGQTVPAKTIAYGRLLVDRSDEHPHLMAASHPLADGKRRVIIAPASVS